MSNSVQMYSFPIMCNKDDITYAPDVALRVSRMITTVSKPNQCFITGLYIAEENQIILDFDLWNYSATFAQQLREAFLTEHNLLGKSYQEIDSYLDDNNLSMPDPCRIDLPTLSAKEPVRITGKFKENFVLTFTELARC